MQILITLIHHVMIYLKPIKIIRPSKNTALLLIVLLLLTASGCIKKDKKMSTDKDIKATSVSEVIHSRKSVRSFDDTTVSDADLEKLVRAAMASPTGKNLQPWVFYIITNNEVLKSLANDLPSAKMLGTVNSAIMVCGDLSKADTTAYRNYWVMDCSAASENILILAEAMGLGACWTAVFPYESRSEIVRKYIQMPDYHIPLNIIPVGYPTGDEKPKDKWKPENVVRVK